MLKTSIALEFRLLKFSFEILRAASFAEARPRKAVSEIYLEILKRKLVGNIRFLRYANL